MQKPQKVTRQSQRNMMQLKRYRKTSSRHDLTTKRDEATTKKVHKITADTPESQYKHKKAKRDQLQISKVPNIKIIQLDVLCFL